MSAPTPGWYPNPDGTGSQRYWDGQQWTDVQPVTPTPAKKLHGWKKAAVITASVIAALLLANVVIANNKAPEPTVEEVAAESAKSAADDARYKESVASANAELQCEELVTKKADSPATADFPDRHTTRVLVNGAHQVRGVVDAQNQFGATVRADFVCTSTPNGDGTYSVVVDKLEQRGN